mmetsp:Transcript_5102/g.5800  ORF Transcript_5102/g.5800 Transcript_5102/m.5800 type:complete len:461 (-) Transcript_5102:652-2034(-)
MTSPRQRTDIELPRKLAVCVVDPWSTGMKLCELVRARDLELILIWEDGCIRANDMDALEVIDLKSEDKRGYVKTIEQLRQIEKRHMVTISCIIPGSETGVLLAESLAFQFGTPTNPPKLAMARRNKFLMGEAVRSAGVRAVKQTIATEWQQVVEFLSDFKSDPFKAVVKPNLGAGSDDVYLCNSRDEVKKAFFKINGTLNSLGIMNDGVLIQEFLAGTEYVVDTMTRNGHHKVVAMWHYDKRPANGRFNVYFGTIPHAVNSDAEYQLKDYVSSVLDALQVENGPAHAEVIMTKTGPCLVEIGCRCHGGNASWYNVAREFAGLDQLNAILDGFTAEEKFYRLPDFVTENKRFGRTLDLVAYESKEVIGIPGIDFVKSLQSFHRINLFKNVGDVLDVTVDCNTTPGEVILIHDSLEQLESDYESIHNFLKSGFFALCEPNSEDSGTENSEAEYELESKSTYY